MGLERVPDMIAAGVDTFKIEGRLKGPEYVYLTTRAYRAAVDAAWGSEGELEEVAQAFASPEGNIGSSNSITGDGESISKEFGLLPSRSELAQVFARGQDGDYDGLTTGYAVAAVTGTAIVIMHYTNGEHSFLSLVLTLTVSCLVCCSNTSRRKATV